jgi:hypothetical protein
MSRVTHPHRQSWIVSTLLFALIVRALIPAGFMPAAGFSFQICPDGYPAHLLQAQAHNSGDRASLHAGHHHDAPAVHGHSPASHHAALGTDPALTASHAALDAHHDVLAAHHDGSSPSNDGTPHRHAAAGTEHCAFAAAAGPALLAWAPAFSAPAFVAVAPDFVYVTPSLKPPGFRVQQPRGPPVLS